MKDKILQLAVECGFDMSKPERAWRGYLESREKTDAYRLYYMTLKKPNSYTNEEKEQVYNNLLDEIADDYITDRLLLSSLGIDFDTIVADKIEEVRKRYGRD